MKILAIEFSSPLRSAAVLESGGAVLGEAQSAFGSDDRQSSDALRLVEEALGRAGQERESVECLVVGLGPGSYTGIRGAISLAQGWQLATGSRLLGISSAACVAAQALAEGLTGRIDVVIDAQRQEFYVAGYELGPGGCRELEPLRLASLEEIHKHHVAGTILAGPEVTHWFPEGRIIMPQAATLGRMGTGLSAFVPGEALAPIYLRETTFVKAPPPRVLPYLEKTP